MKRKLLILVMVLAMASLANATIVGISIDDSTTAIVDSTSTVVDVGQGAELTVSLLGDTASGFEYFGSSTGMVTLGLPVKLAAAGDLATVADYSTAEFYDYELVTASSTSNYPGGILFTSAMVVGDTLGTFDLLIKGGDSPYPTLYTARFNVTPEPMTIALLGLGGLLLRRRIA